MSGDEDLEADLDIIANAVTTRWEETLRAKYILVVFPANAKQELQGNVIFQTNMRDDDVAHSLRAAGQYFEEEKTLGNLISKKPARPS